VFDILDVYERSFQLLSIRRGKKTEYKGLFFSARSLPMKYGKRQMANVVVGEWEKRFTFAISLF